jgi:hypothetical protein
MPRKDRIDAPAALHHIIIRGIERKELGKYRWCGHSALMGKTEAG